MPARHSPHVAVIVDRENVGRSPTGLKGMSHPPLWITRAGDTFSKVDVLIYEMICIQLFPESSKNICMIFILLSLIMQQAVTDVILK